jgi:TetR/AcrR family transcriptional repressor of mexJK operon
MLDASWRLFLAHGVEAVTVDTIAAEAGVSKGTVYAYFTDKRALFQEGVRREMAKIEAAQAISSEALATATLEEVLVAFGIGIMTFLTSDGAVDFYSSLSGELRRDPELARMFYDAGPGRNHANLAAILRSSLAAELHIVDSERAAEALLGMWQGLSNYRLSLGIDPGRLVAEIPDRVADGVALFLKAHAKQL